MKAVDPEIGVIECEQIPKSPRLGQNDQRGVGQVHRTVSILFHQQRIRHDFSEAAHNLEVALLFERP